MESFLLSAFRRVNADVTVFVEGEIFQVWLADCLSAVKIFWTRNIHQARGSENEMKELDVWLFGRKECLRTKGASHCRLQWKGIEFQEQNAT